LGWGLVDAMTELQIAEQIAREAHAGQKEESTGDDYIHHVERVVAMVEGDEAKAVAWLHDVIEDSEFTSTDLDERGISQRIIRSVLLLTQYNGEIRADYIRAIKDSDDQIVLEVKKADLRDHLRPNCPPSLRKRYERELAELEGVTA
jgi:(p)ppGpp synthase/HD superfamily hydrolase